MNKHIKIPILLLLIFSTTIVFSQNEPRIIIKTPRNGHSIYRSQGPNDKQMLTYVDDDEKPFTGKFIEKGWDGELISEKNYINGIMEKEYLEYDTRGDKTYISVQGQYKNGKKIGEWIEWWRPNHKKKLSHYDENGELHGQLIIYAGFSVEEPETIQNYTHGKRDGKFQWFSEGGQVTSSKQYEMGEQEGLDIDYYKNGNKKSEINYTNDRKNGVYTKWYENGKIRMSTTYKNGNKNGKEIFYFENGQKEKDGEYLNGKKKGHFVWYNKDGSIKEETTF